MSYPCPSCSDTRSQVLNSRVDGSGKVWRRRRYCEGCSQRYSTLEIVVLKDGNLKGVPRPTEKASATAARLARLLQQKGL